MNGPRRSASRAAGASFQGPGVCLKEAGKKIWPTCYGFPGPPLGERCGLGRRARRYPTPTGRVQVNYAIVRVRNSWWRVREATGRPLLCNCVWP
jgi:hypothetical protein